MKKQKLQKISSLIHGRLILLAMMIFIGQGIGFSQGIKTVTSDADDGDGSLRQTIADAVDGDVIDFDGAITTITLDSTLNLGDKTLTIDGKEDVILQRDEANPDTFRVVTIVGTLDKHVTIQNLTIQNGYAKHAPQSEDAFGGGLYAQNSEGGTTILDNVTFKNNTSDKHGGGAYTKGLNEYSNIVTNCQFIDNKALDISEGRGGGLFPINTAITGSTFTGNQCGDSGGAIMSGNNVTIDNCVFTENVAVDDAGGAIRMQGGNSWVKNSTFDSNTGNRVGGAIFHAKGNSYNCVFTNNSSPGSGGAVWSNNAASVYNSIFIGNSSGDVGGGIYVDDDGVVENCIISDNTSAINGGGAYLAGNGGPALLVGSIVSNNSADSIGGGVYVGSADIINTTFTKNYAAENGGALSGDGTWLLANSIVYDNDAAGDDKNIQFISNEASNHAANSAIDVTAYDPGVWTASNITTLDASPFVGGSEADSLKLASGSDLIDAGSTDAAVVDLLPETDLNGVKRIINGAADLGAYEHLQSFVVTNEDNDGAGSLRQIIADAVDGESIITFADNVANIKVDQPLELGDKSLIIDGGGDIVLDGAFNGDPALDITRVITVTGAAEKELTIKNLTIQNGNADGDNGGGVFADHSAGGQTMLDNVVFKDNVAGVSGGALSITGFDADNACTITNSEFVGNSSPNDGGAIIAQNTMFSGCDFTDNESTDGNGGAARANAEVYFEDCTFTGNNAPNGVAGAIRLSNVATAATNCVFESNSASRSGAVFMARGSVVDCEFINNTATAEEGGAIFANQDECTIENSLFRGNSSALDGGAVYVDDGGTVINCIFDNNSAANNGGAVFLKGAQAPASLIGGLVTNNTADAQGGGVYVLAGDVINSIITKNYAGVNGGAMSGDGEWFLANSVVFGNDAAGDDKNIEFISNSATDHAANNAIDATAYNDTWTATNITPLEESPFIGGTEADSLYFAPGTGLVDAGTLEYGIADVLPETDLDGDFRIQGEIDLGVYETEVIDVLGVSLDRTTLEIGVDETRTLVATVEPDHASDKSVNWSSSDESVATVEDGVVTGVGDGSVTITVTTVDGEYTATADVTVRTAVTGVTLNETAIELEEGATFTLEPTVEPENATNPMVAWDSDDESVATVDNGLVTAVSTGTSTISAITMDGSFIATCEVTVTEASIAVTGVSLDQETLDLEVDQTGTLVATVSPEDADDPSVTWSSSDDAIATVDNSGMVTGVAEGSATITVTTNDGDFTASADVTVSPVTSINEVNAADFNVYPNPVQNDLFIEGENIKSVTIYSAAGNPVMIVEEAITEGINISGLKSGMYFLKITNDKGTAVKTIIKE